MTPEHDKQRWTVVPRRGIIHLARFVLEDREDGLFDIKTHPMYRRLDAAGKRELLALWKWLTQEDARQHADAPPLHERASAPEPAAPEPETPLLFAPPPTPSPTPEAPAHVAP